MAKHQHDCRTVHTLYPIDSFGIQKVTLSGIRVERLEDRVKPGVPFPHKHDFYQIMFVTQGSGTHQIDFNSHTVTPGQIYLMKPGQMHSWKLAKGIKGLLLEFNQRSLNAVKESTKIIKDFSYSPDLLLLQKKDFNEIANLAEVMLREYSMKREMHDICLQYFLSAFLIQLIRLLHGHQKQEKAFSTVEKFRELLEINFKKKHSVEFYARELRTSPRALTMQLSRSLGKPARSLIQERLLLEAKRYLAFSDLSIAEIGYELGFEDSNYFIRFFKTHEKQTPVQFRKVAKK